MESILVLSTILLWALVLLNLLLTLGLARRVRAAFPKIEMLKVGQQAPDFTAQTLQGQAVSLADYAGRAVAFIFTSPHCQPCREQLPTLQALKPKAEEFNVELVMVSDANENETRTLASELDGSLPILIAPRERTTFIADYKATAMPSYCLVDAHGKVRAAGIGLMGLEGEIEKVAERR